MRCPHCAGEILDGSRFCGICGRPIAAEGPRAGSSTPAGSKASIQNGTNRPDLRRGSLGSMSLFELPVSRGARMARIGVVLLLDVVLAAVGIALIASYLDARDQARQPASAATEPNAKVEGLTPTPVPATRTANPASPAARASSTAPSARRSGSGPSGVSTPQVGPAGPASDRSRDPNPTTSPLPGVDTPPPTGNVESPSPGSGSSSDGTSDEPPADPDRTAGDPDDGANAGAPSADDIERLTRQFALFVDRQQGQLQRCYQQAAKAQPPSDPLQGRIEVRSQIQPNGTVTGARPVSNETGSEALGACVASLVQGWTFSPIPGDEPLEFVWPFRFKAPQ